MRVTPPYRVAIRIVGVRRGPALRTADGLADAPGIAATVAELAASEGEPVTASPATFRSPAWSRLPAPGPHLLVCRGPRCTAYGAGATHRAAAAAARDTNVLVTPTGCFGPCKLGPLVVEHPGGTWHDDVTPERAGTIVRRAAASASLPP
jgi:(2Fe-2S) ferredoxin